jgi:hypothetical protein
MLVLCVLASADSTVEATCHQCGAQACVVMKGGGFSGKDILTGSASCA